MLSTTLHHDTSALHPRTLELRASPHELLRRNELAEGCGRAGGKKIKRIKNKNGCVLRAVLHARGFQNCRFWCFNSAPYPPRMPYLRERGLSARLRSFFFFFSLPLSAASSLRSGLDCWEETSAMNRGAWRIVTTLVLVIHAKRLGTITTGSKEDGRMENRRRPIFADSGIK